MVHDNDPRAGPAEEAWIEKLEAAIRGAGGSALAGLLFAAKDNIDVAGVPTTAACAAFARTPTRHSFVVQRLLDAGASLLGKTNLDQFACGLNGTRSPYGAVPNSFDARYVSGGSSSGSAYVVATGQVDFALGTDTAGSGRVPAGLNNIVGTQALSRIDQHARRRPGGEERGLRFDLRCDRGRSRCASFSRAMGYDPGKTRTRGGSTFVRSRLPPRFRFGVPSTLRFYGDAMAQGAFDCAVEQMRALGGVPVQIDFTPLSRRPPRCSTTARSSPSATPRSAASSTPTKPKSIEPVRSILAQGRGYSAADTFVDARTQLQTLGQQGRRDVGRHRCAGGSDRAHALHDRGDAGRARGAQSRARRVHQLREPAGLRRHRRARAAFAKTACPSASR